MVADNKSTKIWRNKPLFCVFAFRVILIQLCKWLLVFVRYLLLYLIVGIFRVHENGSKIINAATNKGFRRFPTLFPYPFRFPTFTRLFSVLVSFVWWAKVYPSKKKRFQIINWRRYGFKQVALRLYSWRLWKVDVSIQHIHVRYVFFLYRIQEQSVNKNI